MMGNRWRSPGGEVEIWTGDNRDPLRLLPEGSVHCVITSPPYFNQRDYGVEGQIGLETRHDCLGWATGDPCGQCYVCQLVAVFRECRRVLRDDGTFWLNLGDKFSSDPRKGASGEGKNARHLGGREATRQTRGPMVLPAKNLLGMPWRVALALQADGWLLRSDIIWHRVNAMPGSQKDRPTCSHEYLFLLAKQGRYYYDEMAIREPGNEQPSVRDKYAQPCNEGDPGGRRASPGVRVYGTPGLRARRSVWPIPVAGEREAHFAVFPPKLVLPCLLAGTSERGVCPVCSAPYRRVTQAERKPTRPGADTKVTGDSSVDGNRDPQRHVTEVRTVGWDAGCDCQAGEPVPATVLDPFGGSGTVGSVAIRKHRRAILLELNPEYVEIAKRKVKKALTKRGFGL